MIGNDWRTLLQTTSKRKRNEVRFQLDEEVYNTYSPLANLHPRHDFEDRTLLLRLLAEIEQKLEKCPEEDVRKLSNPTLPNYSPLPVVYILISEHLQNPARRVRRKLYTGLSQDDHSFFMSCVANGLSKISHKHRFESLVQDVKNDQQAFHFYHQFKSITDPTQLSVYFQYDPTVLSRVDIWLQQQKMEIFQLPRFYNELGRISVGKSIEEKLPALEWIKEVDTDLESLPIFLKTAYYGSSSKEEELSKEKNVFELEDSPELPSITDEDVVITEQTFLAFLLLSTDSRDKEFHIPVEIFMKDSRRIILFKDPLIKKELDLRQKQDLFFQAALQSRYSIRPRNQQPRWSFSKWKLGPWILLIQKRQELSHSSHELSFDPIPIKLFVKTEFIHQILSKQHAPSFEAFSTAELAKYWLASSIHRKAEIQVSHVSPGNGRRLKNTVFTSPEQIFDFLPSFLQFKPRHLDSVLLTVLDFLRDQKPGKYLLVSQASFPCVLCYRAVDLPNEEEATSERCYDVHEDLKDAGKTCITRIPYLPHEWKPTNAGEKLRKIPHTLPFPPTNNSNARTELVKAAEKSIQPLDYGDL